LLPELKRGLMRFAVVLVIAAVACILLPWAANHLGLAVGFSLVAFQVAGYTFLGIFMLLFFWIMAEAGYKVFLRPSVRARRIRKIRNRRLMFEAASRKQQRP
jgi:hypothetical protein